VIHTSALRSRLARIRSFDAAAALSRSDIAFARQPWAESSGFCLGELIWRSALQPRGHRAHLSIDSLPTGKYRPVRARFRSGRARPEQLRRDRFWSLSLLMLGVVVLWVDPLRIRVEMFSDGRERGAAASRARPRREVAA